MSDARDLSDAISKAAEAVEERSGGRALLVSHYDADGLAAASIMLKTLAKRGYAIHFTVVEQLTSGTIARLEKLAPSYTILILVDMGSGALESLSKIDTCVIVLDHHLPGSRTADVIEVNPHRFNIDGSKEISSSGLAYLLSKTLEGGKGVDLIPLAVVGALGDRQDVGERFKLTGLNRQIVREGVEAGIIEEKIDLRLFGGGSRPLVKALVYTMDPFLPSITGEESSAIAFLKSLGIEPTLGERMRTLNDLNRDERKKLASALVKLLLGAGCSVNEAERIYGATYILLGEPPDSPLRDAREFAQLLNASGRMGCYDLAVALGLGSRGEVLLKITEVAGQYRSILAKSFQCVREGKVIREGGRYTLVDLRKKDFLNERVSGALASLLLPYAKGDKLLLVAVDSPEGLKLSARRRIGSKVPVGEVMARAAQSVGGSGGGHENAGGATIPSNKLEDFLKEVEKVIESSGSP